MKRLAWFTAIILSTLAAALLLWEFRTAVVLFILSLALAAALKPLVDRLVRRGLPHGIALLFTYGACIGLVVALVWLFSGPAIAELQELTNDLANGYEHIQSEWPHSAPFQQLIAQQLSDPSGLYRAITGQDGSGLVQALLDVTLGSFDLFGQITIILVLSIYWNADEDRFKRLWLSLLHPEARIRAREIWQSIETGIGSYLRSELVQSLLAVFLLGGSYYLIGLKYPILLGVVGAIGWLVPWVGILFAIIPASLAGLSIGLGAGLSAAVLTLAVLSFLEFVVEPRLFNRRRFSSLLVVVLVLILVNEYGVIGIVLASPLAAAIQILADELFRPTMATSMMKSLLANANPLPALQERFESVQTQVSQSPGPSEPEIGNLIERLAQLITRAEQEERWVE